jgi:hypothetical protein
MGPGGQSRRQALQLSVAEAKLGRPIELLERPWVQLKNEDLIWHSGACEFGGSVPIYCYSSVVISPHIYVVIIVVEVVVAIIAV